MSTYSYKVWSSNDVKGQIISEWIHEVILSPKIRTKNCPRYTGQQSWQLYFGTNNDFINSFWNCLTFTTSHKRSPKDYNFQPNLLWSSLVRNRGLLRASYCNIFDPKNSEEIRLFEEILVTVKRGEESGTDAAVEFTYLIFYAANALTMSMLLHCTHTHTSTMASRRSSRGARCRHRQGCGRAYSIGSASVLHCIKVGVTVKWQKIFSRDVNFFRSN